MLCIFARSLTVRSLFRLTILLTQQSISHTIAEDAVHHSLALSNSSTVTAVIPSFLPSTWQVLIPCCSTSLWILSNFPAVTLFAL